MSEKNQMASEPERRNAHGERWYETAEFTMASAELSSPGEPSEVRVFDIAGTRILTVKRTNAPGGTPGPIRNIYFKHEQSDRERKQRLFIERLDALKESLRDLRS